MTEAAADILCIGGAAIDRIYQSQSPLILSTSNPATGKRRYGGVARNVTELLAKLDVRCALMSCVGDDASGRDIRQTMQDHGVDVEFVTPVSGVATADYLAVIDEEGELHLALSCMEALDHISPAMIDHALPMMAGCAWVFADCNLPAATLAHLMQCMRNVPARLAVDAVSVSKVQRLPEDLTGIDILFCNHDEACALLDQTSSNSERCCNHLRERGAEHVVLTKGQQGHWLRTMDACYHTPALKAQVRDVTGAGDAMISATLYGLMQDLPMEDATRLGTLLATLSIESGEAALPLSPDLLHAQQHRMDGLKTERLVLR